MPKYLVKRSMSPDGRIDSVSVEIGSDFPDGVSMSTVIETLKDVISRTDELAEHVRKNVQPGAAVIAFRTEKSNGHDTEDSGPLTVTGKIQAVYPGEIKPGGTKPGPGAIIVNNGEENVRVKTFDKKLIELAATFKNMGKVVEATYKRNEKWNSNDITALKEAGA